MCLKLFYRFGATQTNPTLAHAQRGVIIAGPKGALFAAIGTIVGGAMQASL